MLGINGQLRNFNAKGAKIFLRLLKIFLRFARALRSAKNLFLHNIVIPEESQLPRFLRNDNIMISFVMIGKTFFLAKLQ